MSDKKSTETLQDYSKLVDELGDISRKITQEPNGVNFKKFQEICERYSLFSWDKLTGTPQDKVQTALASANKKLGIAIKNQNLPNKTAVLKPLISCLHKLAAYKPSQAENKETHPESIKTEENLRNLLTSVETFTKAHTDSALKVADPKLKLKNSDKESNHDGEENKRKPLSQTQQTTRTEREINRLKILFLNILMACDRAKLIENIDIDYPSKEQATEYIKEITNNLDKNFPDVIAAILRKNLTVATELYLKLDQHYNYLKPIENRANALAELSLIIVSNIDFISGSIIQLKTNPEKIKQAQKEATALLDNMMDIYQAYTSPSKSNETEEFWTKLHKTRESVSAFHGTSAAQLALNAHMKQLIDVYLELVPNDLRLINKNLDEYKKCLTQETVPEKSIYSEFKNFCNTVLIPFCAKEEVLSEITFDAYNLLNEDDLKDCLKEILSTLNDHRDRYSNLKVNILNALEIFTIISKRPLFNSETGDSVTNPAVELDIKVKPTTLTSTQQISSNFGPISGPGSNTSFSSSSNPSSISTSNSTPDSNSSPTSVHLPTTSPTPSPKKKSRSALDIIPLSDMQTSTPPTTEELTREKKHHLGNYPSLDTLRDIKQKLQDLNDQLKKPEELTRKKDPNALTIFNSYVEVYHQKVFKKTCTAAEINGLPDLKEPNNKKYISNLQKFAYRCYLDLSAEIRKMGVTFDFDLPKEPKYSDVLSAFNQLKQKIEILELQKEKNFPAVLFATFSEIDALHVSIPMTMDRYQKAYKQANAPQPKEQASTTMMPIATPVNFQYSSQIVVGSEHSRREHKLRKDKEEADRQISQREQKLRKDNEEAERQISEAMRPLPISKQDKEITQTNLYGEALSLGDLEPEPTLPSFTTI